MSDAFQACAIPIDPTLVLLPDGNDTDLKDAATIMMAKGRKATMKVAGHRASKKPYQHPSHSACGPAPLKKKSSWKSKAMILSETIIANSNVHDDDESQQGKPGRPLRRPNFTDNDKQELLQLVENTVPLGQISWKSIGRQFNEWAKHNCRPERLYKSLETKFKNVRSSFINFLRRL